jgi:probable F420-dependent oxidoreductase
VTLPEHTHIPVGSRYALAGMELPERYKRTLDPFVACSFMAACTSTLHVGTAISLVAQHDAIALAKAIATIDHMSQGRFSLGVGFGYNRLEAEDHGFPPARRTEVVEETVRLMRAVWTEEQAAFEGTFRRVSPSWSWPKPLRAGGPPVLLGARGTARNFERIAEWCDGWIPMGSGVLEDDFEPSLRDLRTTWSEAGRTNDLIVSCFFQPGSVADMTREIEVAGELGVTRMEAYVEDRDRDELLPILDDLGEMLVKLGAV